MQLINEYWVDDNNNRWSSLIYDRKEAERFSKNLNECSNCIGCINCTDCISCKYCNNCIGCVDCDSCEYCKYCYSCINCITCKSCKTLNCAASYKRQPSAYMTRSMGSRDGVAYIYCGDTSYGLSVQVVCGCFRGDLDEFAKKVKETHGDNEYGQAYMAEIAKARQLFGLEGNDEQGTRNV